MNGESRPTDDTSRIEPGGAATTETSSRRVLKSETIPVRVRHRLWFWLTVGAIVIIIMGATSWAVATVLRPADDPLEAAAFTFVTVGPGEVGSSINLNSVAEWIPTPVGLNQASGIVTGVNVVPGDEVTHGSVLYLVNQRPVVIAQGTVPMFRALGEGVEGEDVAQLQNMLQKLGFFSGSTDGKAGTHTVSAIKAWQKSVGLAQTGIVEPSDVIFVPTLPTRVALDRDVIGRGKSVSGGESVVSGLPASPVFTLPVTEAQSAMIPTGASVQVTSPGGSLWDAFAGDRVTDAESQTIVITLTGAEGEVLCGDNCSEVPVTGEELLPSEIISVPTVRGLVVPSSALLTDAGGQIAVINSKGMVVPVTVVASARGMSVIEGINTGVKVRVPAAEGPAQ